MAEPIHIISLGAGVQSSTMALMAAIGLIEPMPTCAIFADTGAEPKAVYEQLDYLRSQLPFPIHVVSGGSLLNDLLNADKRASWGRPPFFVVNDNGSAGQLRRQCTGDYKLDPIRRKVRELVGLTRRKSPAHPVVVQWIGISVDEVVRAKNSKEPWQLNRFPLLEMDLTRDLCLRWLETNGHPRPPKSACVFCPYRDNGGYIQMQRNDPSAFAQAVAVDHAIRNNMPGVSKSETFVHASLTPLDSVDFTKPTARPKGNKNQWQQNLFLNECEGMCGV